MIGIEAYAAAFDALPANLSPSEFVTAVGALRCRKSRSPSTAYALATLDLLGRDLSDCALVCIAGATGATSVAYNRALARSPDGRLTGTDFGTSRFKRVPPLMLIQSLQNQVAAEVSMAHQIQGPCINALESQSALVWLLPNIEHLLAHRPVLLIFATAPLYDEDRVKWAARHLPGEPLAGSVCFLLNQQAPLGQLSSCSSPMSALPAPPWPILGPGLALLDLVVRMIPGDIACRDGDHLAHFRYIPNRG